jgi:hypothetical protein
MSRCALRGLELPCMSRTSFARCASALNALELLCMSWSCL